MSAQYSKEFKEEAIKLVLEGKKSQKKISMELGVANTTLSGWVRKYLQRPERGIKASLSPSETDLELKRMAKELRETKEENEILKKAAAFFAKNQK